jgi:hypothetical protein
VADQFSEISAVFEDMKALPEAQLYLDLSGQYISESRTHASEAAEKSLSKEDREKMNKWQGAGLYGPISGVFGRLEDKYQLDIMRTRNMQPNVEQGKNIFSSNWQWVHNKICNEWNFCKRKKEFADENKLLISIIALVLAGTSWHLRTATAVILLAWHQGPKFMCDCPDEKGESTTPQASES